jgi:hypothetical protein
MMNTESSKRLDNQSGSDLNLKMSTHIAHSIDAVEQFIVNLTRRVCLHTKLILRVFVFCRDDSV